MLRKEVTQEQSTKYTDAVNRAVNNVASMRSFMMPTPEGIDEKADLEIIIQFSVCRIYNNQPVRFFFNNLFELSSDTTMELTMSTWFHSVNHKYPESLFIFLTKWHNII